MTQKKPQIQTFTQPTAPTQRNILNNPETIIQEIIPKTVHRSIYSLIKLDKLPNNTHQQDKPNKKPPKYSNASPSQPLADLLTLARQAEITREQFRRNS